MSTFYFVLVCNRIPVYCVVAQGFHCIKIHWWLFDALLSGDKEEKYGWLFIRKHDMWWLSLHKASRTLQGDFCDWGASALSSSEINSPHGVQTVVVVSDDSVEADKMIELINLQRLGGDEEAEGTCITAAWINRRQRENPIWRQQKDNRLTMLMWAGKKQPTATDNDGKGIICDNRLFEGT